MITNPDLIVVIPVYNEQASVRKVVQEWFTEIENWTENFIILATDDGSTDGTHFILERIRQQRGDRLVVINRESRGYGLSCLQGYRIAAESDANSRWAAFFRRYSVVPPHSFQSAMSRRAKFATLISRNCARPQGTLLLNRECISGRGIDQITGEDSRGLIGLAGVRCEFHNPNTISDRR